MKPDGISFRKLCCIADSKDEAKWEFYVKGLEELWMTGVANSAGSSREDTTIVLLSVPNFALPIQQFMSLLQTGSLK